MNLGHRPYIKKVAIAVEMSDGTRHMLYSDGGCAEIIVEGKREFNYPYECLTDITISRLSGYVIKTTKPDGNTSDSDSAIEGIKNKLTKR